MFDESRYEIKVASVATAKVQVVHYARKTYFEVIDTMPNSCIEVWIKDKETNRMVGTFKTGSIDRHETYELVSEKIREYEVNHT